MAWIWLLNDTPSINGELSDSLYLSDSLLGSLTLTPTPYLDIEVEIDTVLEFEVER